MTALAAHPFDSITADQLRDIGGMKWTMTPGAIGAFVAEMDFGVAPPIASALRDMADKGLFGYLPQHYVAELGEAYAAFCAARYGWEIDPTFVRPLPDVLAAFSATIEHFSTPGSPIILPTPAYMPFLMIPGMFDREIIQVPMHNDNGYYTFDFDAIEKAFQAGGNLFVLCNPHNPIGRVLTREEMERISQIVGAYSGRVFSDEIHAPLVYEGGQHLPYASINDVAAGHTITATSASKAWNLPGLKTAQAILSNEADRELWTQKGWMIEHGASNPGVIANIAAYREGLPWLTEVVSYLDGNRLLLADLVAEHLPGAVYTPPQGTYLGWIDFNPLGLEDPVEFFTEHAGVIGTPGWRCGDAGKGFFRINFAMPRPILQQAIEAMGAALAKR